MNIRIIFFASLLCLISCSKEIEIDTPSFKRQLVLNSLFSPGKPFEFRFGYTIAPKQEFAAFTDTVHLWLYENQKLLLDTLFCADKLSTTYYPRVGSAYGVKVFVQGYDTISAFDSVPAQVPVKTATKQLISVDKYETYTYRTVIKFSDPATVRNYYELFFEGLRYDYDNNITDPVLLNEGDMSFNPESYFFSDELFNGKDYTLNINRSLSAKGQTSIVLRNISYRYYMFRKYWTRHSYNKVAEDKGIGSLIYVGQPQPMYNNIVHGYGVFTSYYENAPFVLTTIQN